VRFRPNFTVGEVASILLQHFARSPLYPPFCVGACVRLSAARAIEKKLTSEK